MSHHEAMQMPWRKPVAVVPAAVRVALVLLAAVAAVFPTVGRAQPTAVQRFFDEFTADWVRNDPNLAVSNRYFAASAGASADAALQTRLERDITPQTEAYRREKVERARRGLGRLGTLDPNAMNDKERLSADVLAWQLTSIVDGAPFGDLKYPLEQFRGANVTLVDTLTISHPIASKTDGDNYLARLALVPVRLREAIAEAKRLDAKNIRPPRFILAAAIAGMRTFIGVPPEQSPFVTALAQKLATVNGLAAGDRDALVAQATLIVRRDVPPAWNEAIALLESQVARSTDDAGLWRFADGAAAYAWQLNANTTTKLTADQIHAIGLEQVARIKGEMEAILTRLGRTEGTLEARIAQLQKDQAYPLTDAGRTQIMADIDVIMKDAQARSKTLFELTPKAAVIAQAFPKYQEATAAGSYNSPSPDGTRPGTFRIPLRPNRMTKFGLKTLVYHETVPGHHYQIALSREDTSQPRFRQLGLIGGLPAISEGWGLYAERLASTPAGMKATRSVTSVSSMPNSSAPGDWSSIPACMPSTGRGNRRLTSASKRARSIDTSSCPGRRTPTCSASSN